MPPATARLEVVAGNAAGMSILVADELLIGRHADGAGRLADDEEISRSHARITLERSGFCAIEDLGSTNGTFVNGLRISGPQTLSEGDSIELGATTLVVRDLPIPANAQTIEPAAPQPTVVPGAAGGSPNHANAAPADDGAASPVDATAAPVGDAAVADAAVADAALADAAVGDTGGSPPDLPPTEQTPPKVRLALEMDFVAREARIVLDDGSEAVRIGFDGGAWRVAPRSD